ncbi:MAG: precorrin-2 C(20)-methyltransferase [Spirochaetaceae bacterium]|jgi:precorrin-2/cobalt-factor-2 C20-methyltransferase|nr:precorrin-2 C(20)-methyltransferase [Spirochaetaceae bacterium]
MKRGALYGVGVGPGDPELITLKAVRIVSSCSAVCFPEMKSAFEIARSAMPEIAEKEIIPLDLPMTRDAETLRLGREKAADRIMEALASGKSVAFLTLGDVSIYSTFGYLRKIIAEKGYETQAVPGITSFCAAAAALGEDLALWEEPLHIIPASYPDLSGALRMKGARVLMKSGSAIPEVRALLEAQGLADSARVVENCGMANQRIWKSIRDMGDAKTGYFTIIIVKDD